MAINCVACKKPVTIYKKSPTDSLDEQLAVVFFLRKFLKYPVVSSDDVFKKIKERDGLDLLADLLKFERNPSDWINFCSCCLPTVQEAQCLFKILTELEGKISILREKIEKSVVESFEPDEETFEGDGKNLFETVRGRIYKRNMTPSPPIEQNISFPNAPSSLPISPFVEIDLGHVKIKTEDEGEEFQQIEVEPGWYETPEAPENEASSINYASQDQVESIFPSTVDQEDIEMYYGYGAGGTAEGESGALPSSNSATGFTENNPILKITGSEELRTFGPESSRSSQCSHSTSLVTESSQPSRTTSVTPNVGSIPTTDNFQNPSQLCPHAYPLKPELALRTCSACFQVFDKPDIMKRHFRSIHKRGSLFQCNACKRRFSRKDSLRRHVVKHCSKMMARKNNLISAGEGNDIQSNNSTDNQQAPDTASGHFQITPNQEGVIKLEIH